MMHVSEMGINIRCMPLVRNVVISVGGIFFKKTLCILHDIRRKAEHSLTL